MKWKIYHFFHLSLLTQVWLPPTWAIIIYTTNLVPPYSKDQSVHIISYSYASPIAPNIINYKRVLQDFSIDYLKAKLPTVLSPNSPFKYNPTGNIIKGNSSIIENKHIRKIRAKDPKYREPQFINWNYSFKMCMDSVENYVRKWIKREKEEVDSLSKWAKAVRSLIQIQIGKIRRLMSIIATSVFKDSEVAEICSLFTTNMLQFQLIMPITTSSQHMRYYSACAQYSDLLDRAQLLMERQFKQDYVAPMLKSSLQK